MKKLILYAFMALGGTASAYNLPDTTAKPDIKEVAKTQKMDNERIGNILKDLEYAKIINGRPGYWEIQYLNRVLIIITDQTHNRMRIISSIVEEKKIKKDQYTELLNAQFDRALDVKYALYENILWSVFAHPLKELSDDQLKDALSQVFFAAHNFGTTYVSTDLQFGGGSDDKEQKGKKK